MKIPSISIIIPIYKVEKYLKRCVDSVLAQTFTDLEIILVDDGSTDESGAKCDAWGEKDYRIKVVHKMNGGLSSARNAGLDIATGSYIYFLDSDDYIEETLLEKVLPYMRKNYDLVSFCYYDVYENGEKHPVAQPLYGSFVYDKMPDEIDFLIRVLLKGRIGWGAWSRIYRRDIVEKYNLRFADNRKIFAEDLYFCLCYCSHAKKVLSTDMVLYYYRKRQDSIMGQQGADLNIGRMNELGKEVLKHYSKHDDCIELINIFPAIHFMIISNVLESYQTHMQLPLKRLRESVLQDIQDYDFFKEQMEGLKSYKNILYSAYTSRTNCEEMFNIIQYILNGRYLCAKIRQCSIKIVVKILPIIRK